MNKIHREEIARALYELETGEASKAEARLRRLLDAAD